MSTSTKKKRDDVELRRLGYTMFMFTPLSDRAKRWLQRNTNDQLWQCGALMVDQRCAAPLASGLVSAGFKVVAP